MASLEQRFVERLILAAAGFVRREREARALERATFAREREAVARTHGESLRDVVARVEGAIAEVVGHRRAEDELARGAGSAEGAVARVVDDLGSVLKQSEERLAQADQVIERCGLAMLDLEQSAEEVGVPALDRGCVDRIVAGESQVDAVKHFTCALDGRDIFGSKRPDLSEHIVDAARHGSSPSVRTAATGTRAVVGDVGVGSASSGVPTVGDPADSSAPAPSPAVVMVGGVPVGGATDSASPTVLDLPELTRRAREVAERRWPTPAMGNATPLDWHDFGMGSGFVIGAQWAAQQLADEQRTPSSSSTAGSES